MAFRQVLKSIIRTSRPILYASTTMFIDSTSTAKPSANQKLTLEPPDVKNLSYDYMIKQSTIDSVNTASQMLTVTYSAIETASKEYRIILSRLIALLQETLSYEVGDTHWDMIVALRAEVQLKKQIVTQLVGFMEYIHKMVVATSEITFLAGMDNLSTSLCQRIDDALIKMQREIDQNNQLEEEYRHIQQKSTNEAPQELQEELVSTELPKAVPDKVIHSVSS
ncbi:uncharacterized protein LOC105690794 isoform X2 [Athalia rosae]|uniref:uncharacterized protein LOC105690794 isoform X2 n=1 Tax=Athalia rosae TaxID=37344 RepID=UPI0020349A40|nr:uncharacterized protein LOC105690794 isoform X2 [Athalia rosae]